MLRTQSIGFICFGSAVMLLISMNLMAGTAPHLVAGTLENDRFTTWLGLQNRSGKPCTVGVQYHRGAMKLPVEKLLTDGEDNGNFFTKELPSHGSTRIEVSTAPGTDTIFTGAASMFFEDPVCLNEVGITAEYRVKPASRVTTISELFSYPVGSATPLGQCTIARINYNPPFEIPAVATGNTRAVPSEAHQASLGLGELLAHLAVGLGQEHLRLLDAVQDRVQIGCEQPAYSIDERHVRLLQVNRTPILRRGRVSR